MKILAFNQRKIKIQDPGAIHFESDFDREIYNLIYGEISSGENYGPVIDADDVYRNKYAVDVKALSESCGLNIKKPSEKAVNRDRLMVQHLLRDFMSRFPIFMGLVCNNVTLAEIAIQNAEELLGAQVDVTNFIQIKSIIDIINRSVWTRDQDVSEKNSGVSTLGTISEALLNTTFEALVDEKDFFKVSKSEVQTYGDFVLMCLPNNLWLSVKSNFARERLLASGFSNDILGVGFFQEADEFKRLVRIRNFQSAGFLAMYCPDVSVSEEQLREGTNTYQQVMNSYKERSVAPPTNINGRPFIRKLSDLPADLKPLLDQKDIRKRTTVNF